MKNQNKYILPILVLFMLISVNSTGQSINLQGQPQNTLFGAHPFFDASELGDFSNNTGKGLLLPRTDLTQWQFNTAVLDGITFPTAYDGMMVYNTATGTTQLGQGVQVEVAPGYYYFSNPNATTSITNGQWKSMGLTATPTRLVDNGDGSLTFTDENNNSSFVVVSAYAQRVNIQDGTIDVSGDGAPDNGVTLQNLVANIDTVVKANETITILERETDPNSFRHTSEDGTQIMICPDLRLVDGSSHITKDAGPGSNGTTSGGLSNLLIGDGVGLTNSGSTNVYLGSRAAEFSGAGSNNVAIGAKAGRNSQDEENVYIGASAGENYSTAEANVIIGGYAATAATAGSANVILGHGAGDGLSAGDGNILIGAGAGSTLANGNDNVIIGGADFSTTTANNQLNIANTIYATGITIGNTPANANVGVGIESPSEKLEVAGNIKANGSLKSATTSYPDYVLEHYVEGKSAANSTYHFKPLKDVEQFINKNKHLPGVTSIKALEKTKTGYVVNMTKLSMQTLEKVEELYLHTINQQKQIEQLMAAQQTLLKTLAIKERSIATCMQRIQQLETVMQTHKKGK